jgi:tRNA-2-methylthio-N6-dimethylallyladenosine synthase
VVVEIDRLVAGGVREITLLGQTVNSYRDPEQSLPPAPMADPSDPDESEFAALLRRIAEAVPRLARLRYTSPHPRHLTPSLIAAHRDLDVLARHVHLPVQSGSDRILKRMIRRYTIAEYLERADALRSACSGLTLSTDVIVGFPGETDEDFEQTLALVSKVRFTGLFGFQYSQRPYTPARKLDDDVSPAQKQARLATLFALSEGIQREHLASLVGSKQEVLVEGHSKAGSGRVTGRTERNEIVHIADDAGASLVGELIFVNIVRSFKHSLEGALTDGFRAGRPPGRAAGVKRTSLPVLASDL